MDYDETHAQTVRAETIGYSIALSKGWASLHQHTIYVTDINEKPNTSYGTTTITRKAGFHRCVADEGVFVSNQTSQANILG